MTTIDFSPDLAGEIARPELAKRRTERIRTAILAWFEGWRRRRAERRVLIELATWDDRLLKDIGLNPYDLKASHRERHYPANSMKLY